MKLESLIYHFVANFLLF